MASIFISHRSKDDSEAERLAKDLQAAGHNVVLDVWELNIGDSIVKWMNDQLNSSRYVVMCYSAFGLAPWMNREWMSTLARQLNGENIVLLPVVLTGGTPPAILADLKYANLATDWTKGISQLLKAIK